MRFGLDAHAATQTSDWHSAARSRKGFSKPVPGFLTELTILSDWGMVGFGAWESRSSCGKTKAKCTLGGKREVASNQSSPGTTNCRAQAQVFRTNRRRFPLLSVWLWCDPSTKIHSTASNGWHLLHRLGKDWVKKKKMKQVGSPRGKKNKKMHTCYFCPFYQREWTWETITLQLGVSRAPADSTVVDNPKMRSQKRRGVGLSADFFLLFCFFLQASLFKKPRCMFKRWNPLLCKVAAAWGSANYHGWKRACEKNPSPWWLLKGRKQLGRTHSGENISSCREWLGILLS